MGFSVKRDFIPLVITIDTEQDLRIFKRVLESAKVNENRYKTYLTFSEGPPPSPEEKMIKDILEKIT